MMLRLNNENRSVILGLLPGGLSQAHVATRFNVAGSTIHVSRLMQRYNVTGSVKKTIPVWMNN